MAIAEGYKRNFETLQRAIRNSDIYLMECYDRLTGDPVYTVCAATRDADGIIMVPIAKLFDGNPYEELTSLQEPRSAYSLLEQLGASADELVAAKGISLKELYNNNAFFPYLLCKLSGLAGFPTAKEILEQILTLTDYPDGMRKPERIMDAMHRYTDKLRDYDAACNNLRDALDTGKFWETIGDNNYSPLFEAIAAKPK